MRVKIFLLLAALSSLALAEDHKPNEVIFGAEVALGSGLMDTSNLLVRVDVVHLLGDDVPVEPVFYAPRISASIPVGALSESSPGYSKMNLEFTPVGVRMEEWDSIIRGEALHVVASRDFVVDEKLAVRVTALHASARRTLPFWNREGKHDFYIEVLLDALGYKYVSHLSNPGSFSGVRVGAVGGELGASVFPAETLAIRVAIGAMIDLNVDLHANVQSDREAYVMIKAESKKWFKLYGKASVRHTADASTGSSAQAKELAVGIMYVF